jgi:hypothetical protein
MLELGLQDNDIVQIKTDSITFVKKEIDMNKIALDKNNFKMWKKDEYKSFETEFSCTNEHIELSDFNSTHGALLFEGYAGCGKTHRIINEVIPKIKDSFIVLSPSHSSIEEYRQNKINCGVIQEYTFNNNIPNEDTVIIDEIGLCDTKANDVIYKCILACKKVVCYGDFKQLLPVNDAQCNGSMYINYAFSKKCKITTNYRNNFTNEYYDQLIDNKINLTKEIKKYNTPIDDAEFIICATNEQCDKYNEIAIINKETNAYTEGCLMMCKTNKLRNKGLYNNFIVTFHSKDLTNVYLQDKTKAYSVTIKEYEAYFKAAYARTLYNCQGKTFGSYHVPNECISYFAEDGRKAYTLISRLKQNLIVAFAETHSQKKKLQRVPTSVTKLFTIDI